MYVFASSALVMTSCLTLLQHSIVAPFFASCCLIQLSMSRKGLDWVELMGLRIAVSISSVFLGLVGFLLRLAPKSAVVF